MVRAIVGTIIEIGKGKINLEEFVQIIENKNRSEAGMSVPSHGLFLADIEYPDTIFLK
jgi:tRNA pseudouridine38-40 synthase